MSLFKRHYNSNNWQTKWGLSLFFWSPSLGAEAGVVRAGEYHPLEPLALNDNHVCNVRAFWAAVRPLFLHTLEDRRGLSYTSINWSWCFADDCIQLCIA